MTSPTRHNHERQPFGKRKPLGECPRCDELHSGAEPRPSWGGSAQRSGPTAEEIRAHFASEKHRLECQPVCTFGDW
jgi:hypothetical protein